jgi:hypothetical protein
MVAFFPQFRTLKEDHEPHEGNLYNKLHNTEEVSEPNPSDWSMPMVKKFEKGKCQMALYTTLGLLVNG